MKENEIGKAKNGYNNRFVRVTTETLAEYLGITLKKAKRNGLSQQEHLEKITAERSAQKRQLVFDFLEKNSGASQKDIAAELGICTKTVRKYQKEYFIRATGT